MLLGLENEVVDAMVFQVDNETFESIGTCKYTSLMWPDAFLGQSTFQLFAPITEENASLLKTGRIVWCGGDNACVITIIKETLDENGMKTFDVKGSTLEVFLVNRIIEGLYNKSGTNYASSIMYDLVYTQAINPSNIKRKIPYLVNAEDEQVGLQVQGYQKTGGSLYDALYDLGSESKIGFNVLFDPRNERLVFKVNVGVDRTLEQDENDPVVFSTDLEDIMSSAYYLNIEDERNVVMVQAEGQGKERVSVFAGEVDSVGFNRRELYVDARDLQSEDSDGESSLTPEEYNKVLIQRGNEKLASYTKTETFEARIRQVGNVQYVYGIDYKKGDKVTVIDKQLGVSISAQITQVEKDVGENYEFVLTFGYSYPTLLQRTKKIILT